MLGLFVINVGNVMPEGGDALEVILFWEAYPQCGFWATRTTECNPSPGRQPVRCYGDKSHLPHLIGSLLARAPTTSVAPVGPPLYAQPEPYVFCVCPVQLTSPVTQKSNCVWKRCNNKDVPGCKVCLRVPPFAVGVGVVYAKLATTSKEHAFPLCAEDDDCVSSLELFDGSQELASHFVSGSSRRLGLRKHSRMYPQEERLNLAASQASGASVPTHIRITGPPMD
ncbi:hypothetical protein CBL_05297 [Carabus blaptoides fortunei]